MARTPTPLAEEQAEDAERLAVIRELLPNLNLDCAIQAVRLYRKLNRPDNSDVLWACVSVVTKLYADRADRLLMPLYTTKFRDRPEVLCKFERWVLEYTSYNLLAHLESTQEAPISQSASSSQGAR